MEKVLLNAITSIINQLVSVICGLILPRLILSHFGSQYNGITTSITQFMACIILMRAGIASVSRAALYKPLSQGNMDDVSGVVNATRSFMKRISFCMLGALILFSVVYPFLVIDEFDYFFSFSLVLILGISVFMDNYFGITYQILLEADQKKYIYSLLSIITTILNTIVACTLVILGFDIRVVKLGSAFVYSLKPVFLAFYISRKYKINNEIKPKENLLSQRHDALAQQIAVFVTNNTDVMVLTIFADLKAVSVYSVYNMVISALYLFECNLVDSCEAPLGINIAKKQQDKLNENTKKVEMLTFASATIIYGCTAKLLIPFVSLYTNGIIDVNYIMPTYAILICTHQFLSCIRLPYFTLVSAAGHFKQTRNGSIVEAIINLTVSILLVKKLGLVGVAIGTLCAIVFRTIQYSIYASKNILCRKYSEFVKRLIVSIVEMIVFTVILNFISIGNSNYFELVLYAVLVCVIEVIVVLAGEYIAYPDTLRSILAGLKNNLLFKRTRTEG